MTRPGQKLGSAAWILPLVLINLVVLSNAVRHDPRVGYDAEDHLKYIEVLSTFRLPVRAETAEFFSPPLPYLLPAMARSTGFVTLWGAAKTAQLLNVLYSIGLTLCLVSLCERVRPGDPWLKSVSLLCLGMLPVYYRTFAFVRGEPLLAFLGVFFVERSLAFLLDRRWSTMRGVALGAALSLVLLSRQWGFFLLPAVALFAGILAVLGRRSWVHMTGGVALVFLVGGLSSAWFYLHLRQNVGSARAFNRAPVPGFSFANRPAEFYFGTGGRPLFSEPIRPLLGNQLLPILHSEMWGDYWSAFVVNGKDTRDGSYLYGGALHLALSAEPRPAWLSTNRYEIGPYLGRANLVALVPGALLLAGLIFGVRSAWGYTASAYLRPAHGPPADDDATAVLTMLTLVVACTLAGYGWFLLKYPGADTIKATYLLQIFPSLSLLTAEMLRRVRRRTPILWKALALCCVLAALHNLPLLFTHYPLAW